MCRINFLLIFSRKKQFNSLITNLIALRIHRSNLVLFGVIPLQFKEGQSADSLGLTGKEQFSIDITDAKPGQDVIVKVDGGKVSEFTATLRIDTESEMMYYKHGGVLNYVIRENLK